MTYRYVKGFVIVATAFVWLRLLVGTVGFITPTSSDSGDSPMVATETEKDI